ncbi:MAG: hypothetical protein M3Z66_19445 [Chloroflexota bacterium]|nr:hypothetical protein [Chloroflexota bacterium]
MRDVTPLGEVLRGLAAATVGTATMDLAQYIACRRGGGTSGLIEWEFGGIHNWQEVSTPGKVGKRLVEAWTGEQLPPRWADLTNSIVHWGFGIQWGALFGVVAGSMETSPVLLGPPVRRVCLAVWLRRAAPRPLLLIASPVAGNSLLAYYQVPESAHVPATAVHALVRTSSEACEGRE